MKLRGHSGAVAIAISVLALVAGGTGAAVATVATTSISDPSAPSHIAHVDSAGRLTTVGATDTIGSATYFLNAGVVNITSPTTASLAITQLLLTETRQNAGIAGSDLTVRLVQNTVDADGNCTTTATRYIALAALGAGDQVDLASSAPLVIKATKNAKYCLGVFSVVTNGAVDATNFYPYYTFGAYVAGGTYTGIGLSAVATAPLPKKVH